MNFDQFLEANISDKFSYIVQEDKKEEDKKDDKKVKDAICMNSSLFMRVLELVREDVDDDEVLHHIVEKITDLCNDSDEPLTMDSYDEIEKVAEEESEDDDDGDSSDDQEDEDLDEAVNKPTYVDCSVDQDLSEKKCDDCKESDETVDECDEKNKKQSINESLSARRRKGLVAKLVGKNLSKIRNRKRADLK